MSPSIVILFELALSLACSALVLRFLTEPLAGVLGRLCPDAEAVAFWRTYARLMLVIVPALLELLVDQFARFSSPADALRIALMTSLAGLLAGLHVIGRQIGGFIVRPERFARAGTGYSADRSSEPSAGGVPCAS